MDHGAETAAPWSSATISYTTVTGIGLTPNKVFGIAIINGGMVAIADDDVSENYNSTKTHHATSSAGIYFSNEAATTMTVQNSVMVNNDFDVFLFGGGVTTVNFVGDTLSDADNSAGLSADNGASAGLANFDDNACLANLNYCYVAGNEQGVIEEGACPDLCLFGTTVCDNDINIGCCLVLAAAASPSSAREAPRRLLR